MDEQHKYDDIINLEHHVSKVHKQMSLENRSAQFAPFAALTEYGDIVKETERVTESRKEINSELKYIIARKLYLMQKQIKNNTKIKITYFNPDLKKDGGKYITITGNLRKIDKYNELVILENNKIIPIKDIIEIVDNI